MSTTSLNNAINPQEHSALYNSTPNSRGLCSRAEFNPDRAEDLQPLGARGADNQPTGRDYGKEDMETAYSDETGQIPRSMY